MCFCRSLTARRGLLASQEETTGVTGEANRSPDKIRRRGGKEERTFYQAAEMTQMSSESENTWTFCPPLDLDTRLRRIKDTVRLIRSPVAAERPAVTRLNTTPMIPRCVTVSTGKHCFD